ncbi:MAG: hypothetical protein JW724_07915 [Candidatus Altiarchaeota archaeon]|nr:hypothetical protein [Candidatus Altiarchaeota archaeon]
MSHKPIKTSLNTLVNIVDKKGEIKLAEAARMTGIDEQMLEEHARILAKYRIIEIHHSFKGYSILKKGENMGIAHENRNGTQEPVKKPAPGIIELNRTKDNLMLFNSIRKRIHEKKGYLPKQEKDICNTPTPTSLEEEPAPEETETAGDLCEIKKMKDVLTSIRQDVEGLRRRMEDDPLLDECPQKNPGETGMP